MPAARSATWCSTRPRARSGSARIRASWFARACPEGARHAAAGTIPAVTASDAPMSLSVVILAAGLGKRMKSDLPKVLQPLAGRPLLAHVIDSARATGAADIHVVYGHG